MVYDLEFKGLGVGGLRFRIWGLRVFGIRVRSLGFRITMISYFTLLPM